MDPEFCPTHELANVRILTGTLYIYMYMCTYICWHIWLIDSFFFLFLFYTLIMVSNFFHIYYMCVANNIWSKTYIIIHLSWFLCWLRWLSFHIVGIYRDDENDFLVKLCKRSVKLLKVCLLVRLQIGICSLKSLVMNKAGMKPIFKSGRNSYSDPKRSDPVLDPCIF